MADVPSPKGKLSGADIKSLLITALLIAISGFFTGLIDNIGQLGLDPAMATLITGALAMLLKLIQKLISGPSEG